MYHLERCRGAGAARSCGQRGQQAVVVAARPPRLAALVATGSSFAPTTTALATSECRRLHRIRRHRSRVPLLRSIRVNAAPTAPTRALHAAARRSLHAAARPQHTTTPPSTHHPTPNHTNSLLGPSFHNRARLSEQMLEDLMQLPGTTGAHVAKSFSAPLLRCAARRQQRLGQTLRSAVDPETHPTLRPLSANPPGDTSKNKC